MQTQEGRIQQTWQECFAVTVSCELHHSHYIPRTRRTELPRTFSCFLFGHLKNRLQSKDSNSGLQMHFFRESENLWTKSALTLLKRFSGVAQESGPMHFSK
jgi:hypothetical protein